MRRDGDKCLLILPMVHQGQSIGLIEVLDHQRERKFSRQEMRLANAVAAQAAVALHNATVFAQLTRSDKDALALRHAIETISAGYATLHAQTTTAGVLQAAADISARALGAISCVASCGGESAGASGLRAGDQPRPRRAPHTSSCRRRPAATPRSPSRSRWAATPATARPSSSASSPPWPPGPSGARPPEGHPSGSAGRRAGPPALLSSAHAPPPPPVRRDRHRDHRSRPRERPHHRHRRRPPGRGPRRHRPLHDPGRPRDAHPAVRRAAHRHLGRRRGRRAAHRGGPRRPARVRRRRDARRAQRRLRPRPPGGRGAAQRHAAARGRLVRHARGGAAALPRAGPPRAAVLVEELGLSWPAHRALPDAEAAAAVLAHLARRAAGLADVERRLLESVSWAPLPVLDACAAQPDEAPPPLVADEPPEGPGPLAILPVASGAWREELDGAGDGAPGGAAAACPASPAASPGSAAAPVRWPTPRPPPTSSPAAASASSRRGPAWARASATCCRRRTPVRPPAAASS